MQFHANISTVPAIGVNKTSAATFNTLGCKRVCSEGQITRESTGAKKITCTRQIWRYCIN